VDIRELTAKRNRTTKINSWNVHWKLMAGPW